MKRPKLDSRARLRSILKKWMLTISLDESHAKKGDSPRRYLISTQLFSGTPIILKVKYGGRSDGHISTRVSTGTPRRPSNAFWKNALPMRRVSTATASRCANSEETIRH